MKKLFALLLAVMMLFSLAACGDNNTTDPNKDNPGTSQSGENNNNESKGAELIDIADTSIRVIASDYMSNLTGDEAAAQRAKIPAEVKKGVGEIASGLCSMTPDYSGTGTFKFGLTFLVPKGTVDENWTVLTDYYKSLGGTVTSDTETSTTKLLNIDFSWGQMYQCETGTYNEEQDKITVGFKINE